MVLLLFHIKYMEKWNDETVWLIFSFVPFIILPFLTLLFTVPDAIELLDSENYKVIYSNNRVEEVFGFTKKQVADWDFWVENIVHPDDKQQQIEYEKSDKFPENRYYRIIRPNGKIVTIKNNHIIKNHNGRKYRIVTNIAAE